MTYNEMETILNRIRINRTRFDKDMEYQYKNIKIKNEWYRVLKDYDYQDIDSALTNWFRDENNNNFIPNVYLLTNNCFTIKEKNSPVSFKCSCMYCKTYLPYGKLRKHENRCRSVKYLKSMYARLYNKEIDNFNLYNIEEKEFNEKYYKSLEIFIKLDGLTQQEREFIKKVLETKDESKVGN